MKKAIGIGVGLVAMLGVVGVVTVNSIASHKVNEALVLYTAQSKDVALSGDAHVNILTSTVAIDNFVMKTKDGSETSGDVEFKGVNLFDKTHRLSDNVTISYRNLTANDTAVSKKYSVSGSFNIQSLNNGDLNLKSSSTVLNREASDQKFTAVFDLKFGNTQDIYQQLNELISNPHGSGESSIKKAKFGMYLKAMKSQVRSVHIEMENNKLLQTSIRDDIKEQNPGISASEYDAAYAQRISEAKSHVSSEGVETFNKFIDSDQGKIDISINQKKDISVLEASFKSAGGARVGALADYYDVVYK